MRTKKIYKLSSYHTSVKKMGEFVKRFSKDVDSYLDYTLDEWYDAVKSIPYVEDSKEEVVSRPKYILQDNEADCKKKSILIASYCREKSIPCRFIVMSNRGDCLPHHIYTEVYLDGEWVAYDATYNNNRIGSTEKETYREEWEFTDMKLITLSGNRLGSTTVTGKLDLAKGISDIVGDSATTGMQFYNTVAQNDYNMKKLELDSEAQKLERELQFALMAQKTANSQADKMQAQATLVQAEKKKEALIREAQALAQYKQQAIQSGEGKMGMSPALMIAGGLGVGALVLFAMKK